MAIPIVLGMINDIYDVNEMRLSQLLSSQDFAFVKGESIGRRQIFGAEASLAIHFWKLIVNLRTHWSV
jgi:hypothetical protein